MWDLLKKAATSALEHGARYVQHSVFIEQLLNMPTREAGIEALKTRVFELDVQKYNAFIFTLKYKIGEAKQLLQNVQANPRGSSWGNCVEDHMAQFMAESQAGYYSGNSPQVQAAEQHLQNLQFALQYAQQFHSESEQQSATASASYPGVEFIGNMFNTVDPDPVSATERKQAFDRHMHGIMENISDSTTESPKGKNSDQDSFDEIAAARRLVSLDSRMTPMMMRVMPGNADNDVIAELVDLKADYEQLLQHAPEDSWLVEHDSLLTKIGQCSHFAGMAAESIRDDPQALEYYREALTAFESAGNKHEIARSESKITELELVLTEGLDNKIDHLQRALLEQPSESLERAETLIALGYGHLKAGDSYGARQQLEEAEKILEQHGNPDSYNLAHSLMSSMQGIMTGTTQAGQTSIEGLVKLRSLYQQLYNAMASTYMDIDPDKAEQYNALAEQMDSRSVSQDFGGKAISLLQGEFKDLLK